MGIIANLVPREGRFFEYFNQHADRIAAASRELMLLLSEYTDVPARAARVERINDLEHEADRITHDTAALLQTIFVTPMDRDDIHRLISRMDDVLDLMQDAAESLSLYDVHEVTAHAVELASLLQNGCERLQAAVALFSSKADIRQVIKLKAIYELLESATDRCQDVADVIEGVVLQNA